MATTEQQFIDSYKGLSADKQQKMYNAGNAQVKQWIDNYKNTQVNPDNIQSNNGNNNINTNTNKNDVVSTNNNVNNNTNNNVNNQSDVQQQGLLKPLSQDYYNQSGTEELNKIVSNLNNYRQTNPEYFTDYDSFKKNFSYDARNDAQKQTLDTWYNGYQRGMELNSKAVSDLATQYKNGLISDSDLEQLRTANQGKYGEVMDYINKQTILSKYDEENTPSASDNPFQAIIDQYYNNLLTASQTNASSEMFDNYKNQMNSPEMTEMSDQLADLDGQLKEYQNELNRIKSDVERRYEGTGASKSKINAIIADESYKIQEAMNTASLQYNTLATKYNNRMTQYQNEFQLQLQEYQFNMQQRNQQMQELGFVMDLMNFETNEQKDEREWNNYVRQYDFQYGNINSKDEASRRRAIENAVDDVLTEFSGITMIRSRDQMVEDIKNLVDGGMSLGEAITKNIREPIMQKDEYKAWKATQYGGINVGGSSYSIDSNGNLVLDKTYTMPEYTAVDRKSDTFKKTWQKYTTKTGKGGQCGQFVNDYLQELGVGRLYTDPIDAKKAVVNSSIPTQGSIAVIDWSNNPNASDAQKQYGHVAIVTDINWNDGTITVRESNHGGDEQIYTNTYKMSQVYGYFDPTKSREQSINNVSQTTQQSENTPTRTVGNMTPTQFDNYVKQYINGDVGYSEVKSAYGDAGLATVTERAQELLEGGYEKSLKITDPNKILQAEKDYMTKFNSMNEATKEALSWSDKMNVALNAITEDKKNNKKTLNGASQTIVTAFNKLLDPNSVVRESEYARTPEGQALFAQIQGKIEQVTKGGAGLTYDNLKGLVDLANQLTANYQTQQNELAQLIKNNADTYGLNINNILPLSVIEELNKSASNNTTSQNTGYDFSSLGSGGSTSVIMPDGTIITRPS